MNVYLLGHLGSVLFTNFLIEKRYKIKNSKFFLGIGSMFPDMIDKPVGSIFFNTGRWYGHSLLFLISLFMILSLLDSKSLLRNISRKEIILWFLGALGHLLGDWGIRKEVVFHPFFGPFPVGKQNSFLLGFQHPFIVISETLGFMAIILIGMVEGFNRRDWALFLALIVTYTAAFITAYLLLVVY